VDGREDEAEATPQVLTEGVLEVTVGHRHDLLSGAEAAEGEFGGIEVVDDVLVGHFLADGDNPRQLLILVHAAHHLVIKPLLHIIPLALLH
jgi:hypothetical protein